MGTENLEHEHDEDLEDENLGSEDAGASDEHGSEDPQPDTSAEDASLKAESGDEELDNAEDDDERERIRARRRDEKKRKREAAREREDTLRRELAARDAVINQMREELNVVQRKTAGGEMAQLEQGLQQAASAYNHFKQQIARGTEAADGQAVAEATERMFQAKERFEQLNRIKQGYQRNQSAPQPLDPRLVNHAQEWMGENRWYDPSGKDLDSRVALTIDNAMAEEGWDPTTREYWDELSKRVKKHLPHRFTSSQNRGNIASKPKSTVGSSGRESIGGSTGTTYKLSAERVSALKEAGLWDDPEKRKEAIKRFRDYDKTNGA